MALDLSQTAKNLIRNLAAKSEDGVFFLCYQTGGTEDPNTGQWVPGVDVKTPVDGARVNYAQNLIDGVSVRTGDFQLLLPFDVAFPDEPYWIETGGSKYSVIGKPEVNHAGKVQLYKLQLRRS